ncbi:B12-binding domain-containing radical SAM protein [Paenibacillus woosongensis]|uniref:Radical SAM protein n=1 Tax=Paenibacillus woosongensis TaxID=307580 RepID=A0A7X3CNS4_9BACL|nr:radical SAM protein [Paenibacillus woosongensis]MUG45285.1 radical SAM protein [Paenibacillus woosongensis]
MNIELLQIVYDGQWEERENLDMQTLASCFISNGFDSRVHNYKFQLLKDNLEEEIEKLVENASYLFLTFDFYAEDDLIDCIYRIAAFAKSVKPALVVCLTGHRGSINYEALLNDCSAIDYLIIGDSEDSAVNLVKTLESGQPTDKCYGIAYKQGEHIYKSEPLTDNFNNSPWPVRDASILRSQRKAKIRTSRGCQARCTFCIDIGYEKKWRGRAIQDVVNEMEHLNRNFEVKQFNIIDNSFEDPGLLGKKRLFDFVNAINEKQSKFYFNCLTRAESYTSEEDERLIKELSLAGLSTVLIGFESGSQDDLDLFNKRAKVEDNLRAYEFFNKYDVNVLPGFIMFNPYSSVETLEKNRQFLNKINKSYSFISFCRTLKIFEGVKLAAKIKEDGLLTEDFNYKAPLKYRFVNKKVGLLAESLNNARYISNASNLAVTLEYGMGLLARIQKNYVEWKEVSEFKSRLHVMSEEFGSHVNKFFDQCLEMVSTNSNQWDEKLYLSLVNELEKNAEKHQVSNEIKQFMKQNVKNSELKFIL